MKKYVFAAAALLCLSLLCSCGKGGGELQSSVGGNYVEGELICLCDTENDAREVAELYGIELKSFGDGVAVFTTDEPLDDVIARGKEKGWPELSYNNINSANSAN